MRMQSNKRNENERGRERERIVMIELIESLQSSTRHESSDEGLSELEQKNNRCTANVAEIRRKSDIFQVTHV